MIDNDNISTPGKTEQKILFFGVLAALLISGLAPHDRLTWAMEVIWVAAGLPLIADRKSVV